MGSERGTEEPSTNVPPRNSVPTMELITIRIPKRRYDVLVSAVAALLEDYNVEEPPGDDFDVGTLDGVGAFDQFDIVRDFAVRLGRADPVEAEEVDGTEEADGTDEEDEKSSPDGADELEIEVHAHHLVALVAAFPDLTGAAGVPEPDLSVAVQGLCYAYLAEVAGASWESGA